MMDVLEHVDNDVKLIKQYINLPYNNSINECKLPSKTVIISVPAFSWMWSGHDEFLGHKRRYTMKQLSNTINQSGLSIEKIGYFYALVFPLAYISRLIRRMKNQTGSQLTRHSKVVNVVLKMLYFLECWFLISIDSSS